MPEKWLYVASGRNGTWYVDKYNADESNNATWGHSINFPTKKLAQRVADELNAAFRDGTHYGLVMARKNTEATKKND